MDNRFLTARRAEPGRARGRPTICRVVMPWRALPILLALAVAAAGTGCGTAGPRGVSPGTPASVRDEPGGVSAGPARTDVPEPARAPALTRTPACMVLPMPGAPEGLAVDEPDGILAVGLHKPDGLALVSVQTGRVRTVVRLPGAPRHLQLAARPGRSWFPPSRSGGCTRWPCPAGRW